MEKEIKETQLQEDYPIKTNKRSHKVLLILIVSLLIVGLLCGAFILGTKYVNHEGKNNKKEEIKYNVYLYKSESEYYCIKKESDCNIKALTIPTVSKDAKIVDFILDEKSEPSIVLYLDKTYKIYTTKEKDIIKTDITEKSYITTHYSRDYEQVYGLIYSYDEETEAYYNLETKQEMYKGKYDTLQAVLDEYIVGSKDLTTDEDADEEYNQDKLETYLLSISEEKEELKTTGMCKGFDVYTVNNQRYFEEQEGCMSLGSSIIYTSNKKVIKENVSPENWAIDNEGNLNIDVNNKIEKYNSAGKLLSTSKSYSNILHVFKDCILYVENNKIKVYDWETEIELGPWEKDYYYHSMISGKFDAHESESGPKPAGYYFIFEEGDMEEGPGVEYYFNPETKEVIKYDLEYIGGYAKPVLYLYPEEKTEVTINFNNEDNLTTTYPKFNEEWKVTAYPNGDLYDSNNKYYYGLYWEEDSNHKVDFSEGFYVSKDNAITFLEEKLTIIGLNEKERNEFIMYWLPILEKNEHNLVYFELTEERESFNKIEISPKPDSLLRMAIHVKKVDGPKSIKEQELVSFERTGFTAVEWGGISYK